MPTNERYWSELLEKCLRGRYLVVQGSSVGVPFESTLERGLGAAREPPLTYAQDVAGGMSKLLERGWRFVTAIGNTDLMVFERSEWPGDDPLGRHAAVLDALKAMHRRAQANEGAAVRERRLREGFAKERAQLIANTAFWKKRFLERCARAKDDAKEHAATRRDLERRLREALEASRSFWHRFF